MSMNTDNLLKLFYEEKENGEKYKQLYHRYYTLYKNAQTVLENRDKGTEKKIQEAVDQATEELQNLLKEKEKEIALLRAQLNNDSSNSGIPTSRTPIGKKKKILIPERKTVARRAGKKAIPAVSLKSLMMTKSMNIFREILMLKFVTDVAARLSL